MQGIARAASAPSQAGSAAWSCHKARNGSLVGGQKRQPWMEARNGSRGWRPETAAVAVDGGQKRQPWMEARNGRLDGGQKRQPWMQARPETAGWMEARNGRLDGGQKRQAGWRRSRAQQLNLAGPEKFGAVRGEMEWGGVGWGSGPQASCDH